MAHRGVKVPISIALVNVSGNTVMTCRLVAQFPSPNTVIAATGSIQENVVELVHEPAISGRRYLMG